MPTALAAPDPVLHDFRTWQNQFLAQRLRIILWLALIANLTFLLFDLTIYPATLLATLVPVFIFIEIALLLCLAYWYSPLGKRYPHLLIPGVAWSMLYGMGYNDNMIVRWTTASGTMLNVEAVFIRSILLISLVFLALTLIAPARWWIHAIMQLGTIGLYSAVNTYLLGSFVSWDTIVFLLVYLFWLCVVCNIAVLVYERLQRNEFNARARLQQSYSAIEQQNERMRHDLALARDIQIGLLPERTPWNVQQVAVHSRSIPAYEVGGDLYTYVALGPSRFAIAVGDISGKGVSAALLMALAASAIEAQARETEQPSRFLRALNRRLAERLHASHMFAALLYLVIDLERRTLNVANAGMIAPLLLRNGRSHLIDVGGLPLGSLPDIAYNEVQIDLQPDDLLVLMSDGVVEAKNKQGELFGFGRLHQLLDRNAVRPERVIDEVLEQVFHFMNNAEQHDDITLVAIQPNFAATTLVEAHTSAEVARRSSL